MKIEILMGADVEYRYTPGTSEYFDRKFGNYLPGEPPTIKLDAVWIGEGKHRIDIKDNLPSEEIDAILASIHEREEGL
jgi:hypothetical protein